VGKSLLLKLPVERKADCKEQFSLISSPGLSWFTQLLLRPLNGCVCASALRNSPSLTAGAMDSGSIVHSVCSMCLQLLARLPAGWCLYYADAEPEHGHSQTLENVQKLTLIFH